MIGFPMEHFRGSKLPTNQDVLRVLWSKKGVRMPKSAAITGTARDLLEFWKRTGIPTTRLSTVREKILRLDFTPFFTYSNQKAALEKVWDAFLMFI
jgi:hypothetical protein